MGSSSGKPGRPTLYYTLTSGLCGSGKFCKTCQAAQNHRLPASPPAKSSNLESRGKEKHFKGEKKGKKYTKRLIERCVGTGTKSWYQKVTILAITWRSLNNCFLGRPIIPNPRTGLNIKERESLLPPSPEYSFSCDAIALLAREHLYARTLTNFFCFWKKNRQQHL